MANITVTNPGLVNVADEAYPAVPPGRQRLPRDLGVLVPVADDGFPIIAPGVGNLPLPLLVNADEQSFLLVDFHQAIVGVPVSSVIDVDAGDDFVNPVDLTEYVVTQAGSFPTNAPSDEQVGLFDSAITAIVDADTGGALINATTRYRITLADSLVPFGITFIGREIEVITSGFPANVGQSRTIEFWSVNQIYVERSEGSETFANGQQLAVGNVLRVDTVRDGFEVVSNQLGIVVNENLIDVLLPVGQDVDFDEGRFEGNFLASSGVAVPFVGNGTAAPPFQGTTEVESQTFGRGLPANVFV